MDGASVPVYVVVTNARRGVVPVAAATAVVKSPVVTSVASGASWWNRAWWIAKADVSTTPPVEPDQPRFEPSGIRDSAAFL